MSTRSDRLPYTVFLVEPLATWAEKALAERVQVQYFSALNEETLVRESPGADGIIIRGKGKLTRRVLKAAKRLKVIGRHGVGLDNIDLSTATKLGITVVNTPEANYRSVAEFTIGLILALCRRILEADNFVREELNWVEARRFTGFELYRKVVGIVGMGRIGKTVATICGSGFGVKILYHDYHRRLWQPPMGVDAQLCSLDDLLEVSDIVTLHVPLVASTVHLLNEERIARMRSTSLLINTSRGGVIDEKALVKALECGTLGGAALDVMEVEPLLASRLQELQNVILTPHIASYTTEAFRAMGKVVFDVLRVLEDCKQQ